MDSMLIAGGVLGIGLMLYLVYAMLCPEKFS